MIKPQEYIFLPYINALLYLIGPGSYISTEIINFDQPFERTPFKPINNFKRTPDCKRASHMLQARAQHKCIANQTFRFHTLKINIFKNCLKSTCSENCNCSICTISIQLQGRYEDPEKQLVETHKIHPLHQIFISGCK